MCIRDRYCTVLNLIYILHVINMANKRKRMVVSVEKKLDAFSRLEKWEGIKKNEIDFWVGETTIKDWKKNKMNIKSYCSSVSSDCLLYTSRCV